MLKIDCENQILALFDGYFWPFNNSHEKIESIFAISAIIPSLWNVFIKFRWHDEKLSPFPSLVSSLHRDSLHTLHSPLYIEISYISFLVQCFSTQYAQYRPSSVLSQNHNLKGFTNLSAVKKIARCTKLHLFVKNCFDLSLNISITKNIGSICAIFSLWRMIFQ